MIWTAHWFEQQDYKGMPSCGMKFCLFVQQTDTCMHTVIDTFNCRFVFLGLFSSTFVKFWHLCEMLYIWPRQTPCLLSSSKRGESPKSAPAPEKILDKGACIRRSDSIDVPNQSHNPTIASFQSTVAQCLLIPAHVHPLHDLMLGTWLSVGALRKASTHDSDQDH